MGGIRKRRQAGSPITVPRASGSGACPGRPRCRSNSHGPLPPDTPSPTIQRARVCFGRPCLCFVRTGNPGGRPQKPPSPDPQAEGRQGRSDGAPSPPLPQGNPRDPKRGRARARLCDARGAASPSSPCAVHRLGGQTPTPLPVASAQGASSPLEPRAPLSRSCPERAAERAAFRFPAVLPGPKVRPECRKPHLDPPFRDGPGKGQQFIREFFDDRIQA